jgi:YebC/PmpR family DNA-binding regulatory protein
MDKARASNIPNDTNKRAVQKGTGELGAESYEELVYEVYGPGGTAVVVDILTDNRNRTAGEIRKMLERSNAKLAASGSVLYLFHKRGHIVFDKTAVAEDALMEAALEAGADDVRGDGDVFLVVTEAGKMMDVRDGLEKKGMKSAHSEVGMYPDNSVRLEGKDAETMIKLVQQLEDHDDVQNVYANYDIDDALLEQLSA